MAIFPATANSHQGFDRRDNTSRVSNWASIGVFGERRLFRMSRAHLPVASAIVMASVAENAD
jgi:hypothetical protein